MITRRLPFLFMTGGIIIKTSAVLLWRFFQPPIAFGLAVTYDPLGFWCADAASALVFDRWRLLSMTAKPVAFDVLLVAAFALECLAVGFVVQRLLRFLPNRPTSQVPAR